MSAALPGEAASSAPAAKPNTSTSTFDDDDFDFEDLPPAQVAPASGQTSQAKQAPSASAGRDDFDAEFDDFSPDFEMVDGPRGSGPVQTQNQSSVPNTDQNQLPPFGAASHPTATSGFDDEDWGALGRNNQQQAPAAVASNGAAGNTGPNSAFSFDDAFGNEFSV